MHPLHAKTSHFNQADWFRSISYHANTNLLVLCVSNAQAWHQIPSQVDRGTRASDTWSPCRASLRAFTKETTFALFAVRDGTCCTLVRTVQYYKSTLYLYHWKHERADPYPTIRGTLSGVWVDFDVPPYNTAYTHAISLVGVYRQ